MQERNEQEDVSQVLLTFNSQLQLSFRRRKTTHAEALEKSPTVRTEWRRPRVHFITNVNSLCRHHHSDGSKGRNTFIN